MESPLEHASSASCGSSEATTERTSKIRQSEKRFNLYSVLELDIKASPAEIRNSYLRLARIWHPDRHQGCDAAKRKFQEIVAAHEVLSSASKRRQYDLGLLDLLDVEDYLSRFQGLILTACGLGMSASDLSLGLSYEEQDVSQMEDKSLPPNSTCKTTNNNNPNQAQASETSRKHSRNSSGHSTGWLLTAS